MGFGQLGLVARFPAVNVATAGTVTLMQLVAPSGSRLVVNQIAVSFNSDTNTDEPYQVQLLRQSGAGTSSAGLVYRLNTDDTLVPQSASRIVFTGEPTAQDILFNWYIHPQVGMIWEPPLDSPILVQGSGRLGIRVLAPIVQANSASGYMSYLE